MSTNHFQVNFYMQFFILGFLSFTNNIPLLKHYFIFFKIRSSIMLTRKFKGGIDIKIYSFP
jgi:hypothetical protein